MVTKDNNEQLLRRKRRVRKHIFGTPSRPRLSVYRSHAHIYAQIIDDTQGRTLASASTLDRELKGTLEGVKPVEAARAVGRLLAQRARAQAVEAVVFDRGGRLYHGRIRALADGSREGGLTF